MESIWVAWMGSEVKQTFYRAGSIRTRAVEAGSGTPLILLHGAGGHIEAYSRNLAEHAKHFHVYAIDMIGHGFTDRPDIAYELDDFANHLRDFLDAIGARTAILSGESLGAMVSIRFTTRFPERVQKLVLNTGMMGSRDEKGREEIRDALERSRAAAGGVTRETVKRRLEWLMHEPAKSVTEELIDALQDLLAARHGRDAQAHLGSGFRRRAPGASQRRVGPGADALDQVSDAGAMEPSQPRPLRRDCPRERKDHPEPSDGRAGEQRALAAMGRGRDLQPSPSGIPARLMAAHVDATVPPATARASGIRSASASRTP